LLGGLPTKCKALPNPGTVTKKKKRRKQASNPFQEAVKVLEMDGSNACTVI
jgi:hypothetical protein